MKSGSVRPLARPTTFAGLSDDVIAALRERVASGYYNQPQVITALAQAVCIRVLGAGLWLGVQGATLPS